MFPAFVTLQGGQPEARWVEDLLWFHRSRVRDVELITGLDFYQGSGRPVTELLRLKTRPTAAISRITSAWILTSLLEKLRYRSQILNFMPRCPYATIEIKLTSATPLAVPTLGMTGIGFCLCIFYREMSIFLWSVMPSGSHFNQQHIFRHQSFPGQCNLLIYLEINQTYTGAIWVLPASCICFLFSSIKHIYTKT